MAELRVVLTSRQLQRIRMSVTVLVFLEGFQASRITVLASASCRRQVVEAQRLELQGNQRMLICIVQTASATDILHHALSAFLGSWERGYFESLNLGGIVFKLPKVDNTPAATAPGPNKTKWHSSQRIDLLHSASFKEPVIALRSGNLPPIFRLPDEILEEIVSELDQHRDLVAFALASRICAALVIPHHTQYRILRVRHTFPDMWAHLARRSDLARNIREVHICERSNIWAADHYPTTLIDKILDGALTNAEESVRIRNICLALSHMNLLHTFTWSWENGRGQERPTSHPAHENAILTILSLRPQLQHVGLHGKFAMHALHSRLDSDSKTYPVWRLANLKSLSLEGESWAKFGNSKHLCHLLANCPNLESLEVPMEFHHLAECRLPKLKKVKLEMQAGVMDTGIDRSRSLFLANHPTIEELFWSPIGAPYIAPDALPNLKSLRTNQRLLTALEDADSGAHSIGLMTPPSTPVTSVTRISDEPIPAPSTQAIVRHVESLDLSGKAADILLHSKVLHPQSLRRLQINSFEDPATLHEIAQIFPNIEWLSLSHPQYCNPEIYDKDAWVDLLPRFKKLEVFRGLGLWRSSDNNRQTMHECILGLVETCPRLRVLDRINKYNEADEHNEIVITRDGDHVNYCYQKKPSRNCFDIMNGLFD